LTYRPVKGQLKDQLKERKDNLTDKDTYELYPFTKAYKFKI